MDEKESAKSITPELRIELTCNAMKRCSVVGIKGAGEAIGLIEGAKELIDDHMILIYLDNDDVVTGIDAFLHNVEELMKGEPNRALSRAITHFSAAGRIKKVIIVQALPKTENPTINSISNEILGTIIAKMILFDIQTVDCILMGTKVYFSFKESEGAWDILQSAVKQKSEFLGVK